MVQQILSTHFKGKISIVKNRDVSTAEKNFECV